MVVVLRKERNLRTVAAFAGIGIGTCTQHDQRYMHAGARALHAATSRLFQIIFRNAVNRSPLTSREFVGNRNRTYSYQSYQLLSEFKLFCNFKYIIFGSWYVSMLWPSLLLTMLSWVWVIMVVTDFRHLCKQVSYFLSDQHNILDVLLHFIINGCTY